MKKIASALMVAGLAAVAIGTSAPQTASADEFVSRYTYYVNGVEMPRSTVLRTTTLGTTDQVLTAPAVIENSVCAPGTIQRTLTSPAVITTTQKPVMIEHHEDKVPHLFHLGLWPLVDFSIF